MAAERNQTDYAVLNTAFSIMLDALNVRGEKYEDGYLLLMDDEYITDDENNALLFKTAAEVVRFFGDRLLGLQALDELTIEKLEVDDFVGLANAVGVKDYPERWENTDNILNPSFNSYLPFTAAEWRDVLVKMVEVTDYKVTDLDNPFHKLLNVLLNSEFYSDGAALGGLLISCELLADQSGVDLAAALSA